MNCRFCKTELEHVFIDLVNSPASNSFLTGEDLNEPEIFYPLKVYTCSACFLVQLDEYKKSDAIFDNNYYYFSSFSKSWLAHANEYTGMMIDRFQLDSSSKVIEIASNDGYLLQYFKEKNIPVLGIEPTANTAKVSADKGIENIVEFFGVRLANKLADEGRKADVLLGNNVLAHVPDIIDFVAGMKLLLNPSGVITMEFPHLMQLVDNNQFDTIYHEHFSYLSFTTALKIFRANGLEIFDVQELSTHGGSLRIFVKHREYDGHPLAGAVKVLLQKEAAKGMLAMPYYSGFQQKALTVKIGLLEFLIQQKKAKKKVAAYGAAAKGNTLLNYCGITNDLVDFVVDASPHKQNKFLPASHIPVMKETYLSEVKPDYIIILPWNLCDEIIAQLTYVKEWGAQFVIPVPSVQIVS